MFLAVDESEMEEEKLFERQERLKKISKKPTKDYWEVDELNGLLGDTTSSAESRCSVHWACKECQSTPAS